MKTEGISQKFVYLLPLLAVLTVWQWAGSQSPRMTFLYGTPLLVVTTLIGELGNSSFWMDIGVTGAEVVVGFIAGNFVGTSLALVLWFYPRIGAIALPYVIAIGSIPIFAVTPLIILWFGVGFIAKLMIIVFSTGFVALAYSLDAAFRVGKEYDELIFVFGGRRLHLLRDVVYPGTLQRSFVAYRLNVGFSLIAAYVGEWISARHGLGQYILRATTIYDVPRVWTGLIIFVAMAFVLYFALSSIQRMKNFRIEPE